MQGGTNSLRAIAAGHVSLEQWVNDAERRQDCG